MTGALYTPETAALHDEGDNEDITEGSHAMSARRSASGVDVGAASMLPPYCLQT